MKKFDPDKNGTAVNRVDEFREKHKKLKQLRIDKNTIILVPESKCTEEYAEKKRNDYKNAANNHF